MSSKSPLPLYALFGANSISLLGSQVTLIAVPWYVLVTTGSAAKTGMTGFAEALGVVLSGFAGGTLVDRLGHKRASVLADIGSALAIGLIPILASTTGLAFWQLLVLVFLGSTCNTPGITARKALIPQLSRLAGTSLERANATIQTIQRGASMIGSPLAGILVAMLGASHVLWIDSASFLVSAMMIGSLVPRAKPHDATTRLAVTKVSLRDELTTGMSFIWRDKLLFTVVATIAAGNFLESPLFAVVLPTFVQRTFGDATVLGILLSCLGGGSVAGAVLLGVFGKRLPRRATFNTCFILLGLAYCGLVWLPPLGICAGLLALAGLAAGPINPIMATIQHERVPAELMGRVFGATTSLSYAAIPLGVLGGGLVVQWLGVQPTLAIIAGGYLLTAAGFLVNPTMKGMSGMGPSRLLADRDKPGRHAGEDHAEGEEHGHQHRGGGQEVGPGGAWVIGDRAGTRPDQVTNG
ncbi:MAG TPA: MFS transporter [Thermomicrobiaceae bacterium]|nr:MFS transporter [Thermomicrobiaceae bacterium]